MGRSEVARAEARLEKLELAVTEGNWNEVAAISWEEYLGNAFAFPHFFLLLFLTGSHTRFLFWIGSSPFVLNPARAGLDRSPIVTMDAGPNIHIIIPTQQEATWRGLVAERFPDLKFVIDRQGAGAKLL